MAQIKKKIRYDTGARKKEMKEHYDAIIVGTGAAGLYCALNLPEKMKILLITKQEADQSDSFLAQGGICMLRGEDDYENYFEDTMRLYLGHRKRNPRQQF